VQVCDPADLVAKMAAGSVNMPGLRRLLKCLAGIASIAELLEQRQLQDCVHEMLAFLHAWFDFDESSVVGVVKPGNEALDILKQQYSALPGLLQEVCKSCLT
jgi:hypothetical protein